jgi:hypothetical protein
MAYKPYEMSGFSYLNPFPLKDPFQITDDKSPDEDFSQITPVTASYVVPESIYANLFPDKKHTCYLIRFLFKMNMPIFNWKLIKHDIQLHSTNIPTTTPYTQYQYLICYSTTLGYDKKLFSKCTKYSTDKISIVPFDIDCFGLDFEDYFRTYKSMAKLKDKVQCILHSILPHSYTLDLDVMTTENVHNIYQSESLKHEQQKEYDFEEFEPVFFHSENYEEGYPDMHFDACLSLENYDDKYNFKACTNISSNNITNGCMNLINDRINSCSKGTSLEEAENILSDDLYNWQY